MKLRTSYFNGKVLYKDITRFSPVWALYSVFLVMYLMLLQSNSAPGAVANSMMESFTVMVWVNLIYGFICAGVLFGDLFNSRMCNALHAMPMRREGWFLTHLTAGVLFSLVPNGIFTLITAIMMEQYYYIALIWLAVMMLQFLFFFGLGVFCAMCAGNRLAMAGLYGIVNFFGAIVYWLAAMLYEPLLYGVTLDADAFLFFCPAVQLTPAKYADFSYGKIRSHWGGFIPAEWYYLFGVAGLGVVLLGLALLIYRRRKLESAGDFISLRPCAPVFLVICSLASGTVFYSMADAFGFVFPYFFLVFGVAVGFFIARMLLDRTVKVFRGKVFLGLGILVAALLGSLWLTWLDPTGIASYIPKTEQVDSVIIYSSGDLHEYRSRGYGYTDTENIDQIRDLHRLMLEEADKNDSSTGHIYITYRLKDGRNITREYRLIRGGSAWKAAKKQLSRLEYLLCTDDVAAFEEQLYKVVIQLYDGQKEDSYELLTTDQIKQLMIALEKDSLEANLAQDWIFHPSGNTVAWVNFTLKSEKEGGNYDAFTTYLDLTVFDNSKHTAEFIKGLGTK